MPDRENPPPRRSLGPMELSVKRDCISKSSCFSAAIQGVAGQRALALSVAEHVIDDREDVRETLATSGTRRQHVLVIRFGGPNCLLLMSMEAEGVARRTLVLVNPEDRSALGMQDSLAHKVVNSTSGLERASYLDGWFWPFAVVHSTFSGKFECPLLGAPFDCDQIRRSLQDWVPLHRMGNYTNQATLVWVCRITSGVASLLPNDGTAKKSPSAGVPFHRPPITINQGNPEKFFPPAIVWPPAT